MYLEEIVEVAIGLVFVYVVMSLAVMQIQEWLSGVLRARAKHLEEALRVMLAETLQKKPEQAQIPISSGLLDKLYSHPLIKTLSKVSDKPSYIPADKFALALFDLVMTAGTEASTLQKVLLEVKRLATNIPAAAYAGIEKGIDELAKKAAEIGDDPIKLAQYQQEINEFLQQYGEYNLSSLFDTLVHASLPQGEDEVIKALKRGTTILTVGNLQLEQTLDDLILQAEIYAQKGESILLKARTNAEKWFNDTMDRASGWYRRNAQKWAFAIGFTLAIMFNVDTIQIATQLWRQPTLRQSITIAAANFKLPETNLADEAQVASAQRAINQLQSTFTGFNIPVGWKFEAYDPEIFDPRIDRCTLFPRSGINENGGKDVFGLASNGQCKYWSNPPQGWGIISKVLGMFITGMAAMQGAPFWFDILAKLVNVRSAGKKPEEKKE